MKTSLIALLGTLLAGNALAGGGSIGPPLQCGKKMQTIIRDGFLPDRGGNQVRQRIVLESSRCEQAGEVKIIKNLYVKYDAPRLRQKNDGLLTAITMFFSGAEFRIFRNISVRESDAIVEIEGISMQIGGGIYPDTPLEEVPSDMQGDEGTVIEVFGNAFPTHRIFGPFR